MSGATGTETAPELMDSGGRALKLQTDTPHLVNIGGDRLSTSVTLHPIPQGRVTLGCGPGVDVPVHGTGVLPLHCHIENSEGVVTIYPLSDNLSIDGVKISRPTRLSQGVMLTIGRSNYLRFNHPAEAKIMKSVLPNPRISMASITFEPDNNLFQPKFNKKPPAVPKRNSMESLLDCSGVEEPSPSSIKTKVSKFEYLAQQNLKKSISPKVFSSNLVTVNTPAKDVLGKNFQNFTKSLPQNALNYSELNSHEKEQGKIADRPIFGKKSPQYVNVTVNETKNINNRVIIYENGCIPKNQNINLDHNELNNKTSSGSKNINVNKMLTPSPAYNRNPSPYFRSITPSPVSNTTTKVDHRRSGSMGELTDLPDSLEVLQQRNNDAEVRRTQAHKERIMEQEMEKVEQARLEEILNMCVEYEKQAQCEKTKPTPNRIKTNGSLPRDKRQCACPTPPSSPGIWDGKHMNHSYENVNINSHNSRERVVMNYENVEIMAYEADYRRPKCGSPYENVHLQQNSPRTRIKTIVPSNRDNTPRETAEIIENKFAILEAEQLLLQNISRKNERLLENNRILESRKESTTKFIFPLEESELVSSHRNAISPQDHINSISTNVKQTQNQVVQSNGNVDKLKKEKKELMSLMATLKRQLSDIETQEEEFQRTIEMEFALISGEYDSKLIELDGVCKLKDQLVKRAEELEKRMQHRQIKQGEDQKECRKQLNIALKNMALVEDKLSKTHKVDPVYEEVFEEYLKAQETLDNEKKNFEDLEFHHLEEEADWLASREEVQREIVNSSRNGELLQVQIQELEQQKDDTLRNKNAEMKVMKKRRLECLMKMDKITNKLRSVDNQLSLFLNQESEQEESTDSDSDKSKDFEKQLSNLSLNVIHDLSCSVIVSNSKTPIDHVYNMSQSFNEKLLQEKSILESGTKYPSQDDIDRISKVTSSAPIDFDEGQGSLGRKTIESLKDIQRKRHLHLCQQGSQVIEQERQRVLALKQRVQQEVRSQWAQTRQDSRSSQSSPEAKDLENGGNSTTTERSIERPSSISPVQNEPMRSTSDGADSPRPMSEISEMSVEVGGTAGRKRFKSPSDKQRPLTRYLPIRGSDLDLRQHIESAGHQVVLCPHVIINSSTCRGFLHKKGSKLNGWSKRWFVFDRNKHTFTYYNDKSEKKPRGGAYFQAIEEVYLDHLNNVKSPNPQLTFIVKTHERFYYLMAPSPEAMRIWVDVIFTGAEGYQEFDAGT